MTPPRFFVAVAFFALLLALPSVAHAQRTPGSFGVGGQLGAPSGVSVKYYGAGVSYDLLAAWDLDDFFFLNSHALYERPITLEDTNAQLEYFLGPGAFVGIADADPGDDEVVFGASGTFGLNWLPTRELEVYVQFTPRLSLIPDTSADLGGGLGLRFYF